MWIDMRRAAALSMGISRKKRAKRNFLMFGLNLDRRDGSQTQHSDTLCGSTESLLG